MKLTIVWTSKEHILSPLKNKNKILKKKNLMDESLKLFMSTLLIFFWDVQYCIITWFKDYHPQIIDIQMYDYNICL
jgi:hypothetical protein